MCERQERITVQRDTGLLYTNASAPSDDVLYCWPDKPVLLGSWVWWVHVVRIIKIPAPRERLLMLFDTLQYSPEHCLFQEGGVRVLISTSHGCLSLQFSLFISNLQCLCPKGEETYLWDLMKCHFLTQCVCCGIVVAFPKQQVTFSSFFICKVDLSEVRQLCPAVLYCPMQSQERGTEMSPCWFTSW